MNRKTVTKDSVNKGRVFYVCSKPREEQCRYYRWKEDERQWFLAQITIAIIKSASYYVMGTSVWYSEVPEMCLHKLSL